MEAMAMFVLVVSLGCNRTALFFAFSVCVGVVIEELEEKRMRHVNVRMF
jgi:hypothetical protein